MVGCVGGEFREIANVYSTRQQTQVTLQYSRLASRFFVTRSRLGGRVRRRRGAKWLHERGVARADISKRNIRTDATVLAKLRY